MAEDENGPNIDDQPPDISIEDAGRRLVLPAVAARRMNMYPTSDNELENLSFINSLSITSFSIGSFLLSWPITIWINLHLSTVTPGVEALFSKIAWILLILSIVCFGFGLYSLKKRKTIIENIKNESITDAN